MKGETQVLHEICEYLNDRGIFFWRNNNVPVFSNGRHYSLPKYTPKGLPDIFMLFRTKLVGIEVKREGSDTEREKNGRRIRAGKLTPEQADFGVRLTISGGDFLTARNVKDVSDYVLGNTI